MRTSNYIIYSRKQLVEALVHTKTPHAELDDKTFSTTQLLDKADIFTK